MTTTSATTAGTAAGSTAPGPTALTSLRPVTLGRVVRSEWIKLRTLRSTWLGLAALVVLLAGIGASQRLCRPDR